MPIAGIQKMTLLDYPGRVACTVFLAGCNYRCPFCHNSQLLEGPVEEAISREALLSFLERRRGLLDGVCITGGEPTLSQELPELLADIKALGYAVKLDSNGSRPEVLRALVELGLVDYIAMDIKNSPGRYAATCGRQRLDLEKVRESFAFLMEGRVDYELRTTVVNPLHDAGSIGEMGRWLAESGRAKQLFLQSFVDRDTVAMAGFSSPNPAELADFAKILAPFVECVKIRGTV